MRFRLLRKAASKNQKGTMAGILILVFLSAVFGFSSLYLYQSGQESVAAEMERLGFGDFTAWVSGQPEELVSEIESVADVGKAVSQPLIFAGYKIKGEFSDDEGQLLVYDGNILYRFRDGQGEQVLVESVKKGEIYISPAMRSAFEIDIGDTIRFELTRKNEYMDFTVAGYFEDAFMGSSMIDMKSFLISHGDRDDIEEVLQSASAGDVLARSGAMLHIYGNGLSGSSDRELQKSVLESTSLPEYLEFMYSKSAILSYMLLLQNILAGFLISFSCVLWLVCLIVIRHSLVAAIEQGRQDIAVLKAMGMPGKEVRRVYLLLYGGVFGIGMVSGMFLAFWLAFWMAKAMISATGLVITIRIPIAATVFIILCVLFFTALFLYKCTNQILKVTPVQIFQNPKSGKVVFTKFRKRYLGLDIAIREILSGKMKYLGIFVIASFLVFFLSVIGRMESWLGMDGEGLMDAFSVAEHDLGVQPFNQSAPMDEIERAINWYSPVREKYELAMQSVTVNGQEYTANVLNDTSYFHVLRGEVCKGQEILVTDMVADELGVSIGDMVQVASAGRWEDYRISGIYQCANGMGSNIGMALEGYSRIGDITSYIWCYHYILEDGGLRDMVMKYLQEHYQGVDVHTNSWSGLDGIVSLMHLLIVFIYVLAAVFILITVSLVTGRLLRSEAGNMAVYKSIGISAGRLKRSFALRFLLVVLAGSLSGTVVAGLVADRVIAGIFKNFGIAEFSSSASMMGTLIPFVIIPALFYGSAWLSSAKISQISIVKLINESED